MDGEIQMGDLGIELNIEGTEQAELFYFEEFTDN